MTVDHLEARLCGRAGTHQYFQFLWDVACTESTDILRIDGIRQTELLTHSNLRGSTTCQRLGDNCRNVKIE